MLYIRFAPRDKQAVTKYSAFISFSYNQFYVTKVKELPVRFYHGNTKEWEIPSNLVSLVQEIDEVRFLNEKPEEEIDVEVDPNEFKTKPLPHQIDGVKYGILNNSWLLGDQQGLGKTKQMIDLAVWKKHHAGLKHCLIICGVNNLKYNWLEEIEKHSNETACILGKRFVRPKQEPSFENRLEDLKQLPSEFFWITNIESLRCKQMPNKHYKSEIVDMINEHINNKELGLVIVDEIHKAKNPNSAQGRGLMKIKGCPRIGLSGTLLVNKPLDLFMPLAFIEAIKNNYYQFKLRYIVSDPWGHPIGFKNMAELRDIINVNMLRRTKDLLDLPPKITENIYLEMSKEEESIYNEILNKTIQECDLIKSPRDKLASLVRLRQVCCHTGLVSSKVRKSSKFEKLRDILEEAKENGEKVIVFSMFREVVSLALEEFKEYDPLHIWGQMNQQEIMDQKNKFQNEPGFQVLFGVVQAAGTGITLNEASIVVFLDLPWNKATMEQAEDRAHRIGTKKTVVIIKLLMKDTIDEAIDKTVMKKAGMGEVLVDGKDPQLFREFLGAVFRMRGEGFLR